METTEKIVEAYVRYVKGWFTIPNIKCGNQKEIDLLALDASSRGSRAKYHIESGVSISEVYSGLTTKPFSKERLKSRKAEQRRTIGYFAECKFDDQNVLSTLSRFGFVADRYQKVIVSWGWDDDVPKVAPKLSIQLWDFRDLLREIADVSNTKNTYFTDDTMRTFQLMARTATGKRKT